LPNTSEYTTLVLTGTIDASIVEQTVLHLANYNGIREMSAEHMLTKWGAVDLTIRIRMIDDAYSRLASNRCRPGKVLHRRIRI
jgi:hypothetical protein